jgi:CBS domain containing-hemolysin-like protein
MLVYDLQEPIERLFHLLYQEECGKIPVCDGGLDRILGVLYIKDLAGKKITHLTQEDLLKALNKPLFVPETTQAVSLLRQLDDAYQSLALVVDEYGSVSGLLTREDLLEVIIGEIIDRRDHKNWYSLTEEGSIIASASWDLEGVEELLGLRLPNPLKAQSLGGWLSAVHGSIPEEGWKSVFEDYIFEVTDASPSHLRQIKITRMGASHE